MYSKQPKTAPAPTKGKRIPHKHTPQEESPPHDTVGEPKIYFDGDPQAGYPAILALTRECPFNLSHLS